MTQQARTLCAASIVLALALALRLAGAGGELFLDEIWTLRLLRPVTSPLQIMAIHHDNNHYLNSLWLYAAGPDAPVRRLRALSVALGTLAVAAAGWWNARRGRGAILAAMLLFAVAYAPVHYGSEARGYAGLILFTILAFRFTGISLNDGRGRWPLAAVALLGLLCHLTMAVALAACGGWAALRETRRQPDLLRAARATALLLLPTAVCITPVFVPVARSMLDHSLTIGMVTLFDPVTFVRSYGLLIRSLTGVPYLEGPAAYLALPAVALALGCVWRRDLAGRLSLYMIAILVLPALMFLLRLPNTNQPRYFLAGGIAYLLLVADLAGIAWSRGGVPSIAAILLLVMFVGQESVFLSHFLGVGRGHYREAVAAMTSDGPARYATNDDFRNAIIVDHYASRLGVTADLVRQDKWCAAPPDWYIAYTFSHDVPEPVMTAGPAACPAIFADPQIFPYWGLSGFQWNVYKRRP